MAGSARRASAAARSATPRAVGVECPTCGVGPGQECTTSTGNRAKKSHAARTAPAAAPVGRSFVPPDLPIAYQFETKVFDPESKLWVSQFDLVEFLDQTRADWAAIWSGALAAEYRPEDGPALRRFMVLYDRFNRGELDVSKQLDAMERQWGLTWGERRRQGVNLPPVHPPTPAKTKDEARGRMKVVD